MERAVDQNNIVDWHGTPAERLTNQRKVYVGDLQCTTTTTQLKSYFRRYGVVDDASVQQSSINPCYYYGFVTFDDPITADNSINQNPHFINGRWLNVRRALPSTLFPMNQPTSNRIFVHGITATITEDDLNKHFGYFGKVLGIGIPSRFIRRHVYGYCFIHFAQNDAAERVRAQKYHYIKGHCLVAHKSFYRHNRKRRPTRLSTLFYIVHEAHDPSNDTIVNSGALFGQDDEQNNGGGIWRLGDTENNANSIIP